MHPMHFLLRPHCFMRLCCRHVATAAAANKITKLLIHTERGSNVRRQLAQTKNLVNEVERNQNNTSKERLSSGTAEDFVFTHFCAGVKKTL